MFKPQVSGWPLPGRLLQFWGSSVWSRFCSSVWSRLWSFGQDFNQVFRYALGQFVGQDLGQIVGRDFGQAEQQRQQPVRETKI